MSKTPLIVPRPVIKSMSGIPYLQEEKEGREKEGEKKERKEGRWKKKKNGWKEEMILSNEVCFGLLP